MPRSGSESALARSRVAAFRKPAAYAILDSVDVSAGDIARIPPGNLRVPVAEFGALWRAAERQQEEQPRDWYGAGVVVACRWLANAIVRPDIGPWYPAESPVTERTELAIEELIEAEYLAAVKLAARVPRPAWLRKRPGWIEAIEATLHWAWHGPGGARVESRQPMAARRTDLPGPDPQNI